jgi:DNA-binding NarL/FixJ family response regulator
MGIDLTPRQEQLMWHLVHGKSLKQTAEDMFLTYNTIKTHRTTICNKLGAATLVEAMYLWLLRKHPEIEVHE